MHLIDINPLNDYLTTKIEQEDGELLMLKEMSRLALIMVAKTLFSGSITEAQITSIGNKVDYLQAEVVLKIRQPFFAWWRKLSGRDAKNKVMAVANDRRMPTRVTSTSQAKDIAALEDEEGWQDEDVNYYGNGGKGYKEWHWQGTEGKGNPGHCT